MIKSPNPKLVDDSKRITFEFAETVSNIVNSIALPMSKLFGSLDIEIWNLFAIWSLKFEI
jgi:hypothetical protein